MNFTDLKTEFAARGFDHLSSTRQGYYVNKARADLDDVELWPYRETSATGTSPLSISDLGTIEMVVRDSGDVPLEPRPWRMLVEEYNDLSTTGSAEFYYVAQPDGGSPQVCTYPSGDSIQVQYWQVPPDLSAGSDTPMAPSRYHLLIVDMAVARAYRDSDNHAAAEQLQVHIERELERMRFALLVNQTQGPAVYARRTDYYDG